VNHWGPTERFLGAEQMIVAGLLLLLALLTSSGGGPTNRWSYFTIQANPSHNSQPLVLARRDIHAYPTIGTD